MPPWPSVCLTLSCWSLNLHLVQTFKYINESTVLWCYKHHVHCFHPDLQPSGNVRSQEEGVPRWSAAQRGGNETDVCQQSEGGGGRAEGEGERGEGTGGKRRTDDRGKIPGSLVCLASLPASSSMSGLSSSSGCTRRKRRLWRRKDGSWKRRWTLSTEERWRLRRWLGRLSKVDRSRSRRTRTRRSKSAFLCGTNSYELIGQNFLNCWYESMRSCHLPATMMAVKLTQRHNWMDTVRWDIVVIACRLMLICLLADLQGWDTSDHIDKTQSTSLHVQCRLFCQSLT